MDTESIRTGLSPASIERSILDNLNLMEGRVPATASRNEWYIAVAYAIRDRIFERWMDTIQHYISGSKKAVCYFSAEFLIGPQLLSNIINLGIVDEVKEAFKKLGLDFDQIIAQEQEPGLGNGGLGRLAACFIDSLASLETLAVGYGIRYEYGIFRQMIQDGWQVEKADNWLHFGNPWEVIHPEIAFDINFGGYVDNGVWKPAHIIRGIACDTPAIGYKVNTVNLLRLWKSEATEAFNFQAFNTGSYWGAVEEKINSENLTKVLYPNDEAIAGRELRLKQQYFFVSCSLQDMIRVHFMRKNELTSFHKHYAVQLNDTHPAIAIAELMRLLIDQHNIDWDLAWNITKNTFSYTNHTLLPEALETWPVSLFQALLPRHMQIIFEINHRFLTKIRSEHNVSEDFIKRISIIDEYGEKYVRMANLACAGSHAINGVAALHSELLKQSVLKDFFQLFPEKFFNVTNGVTPRRWLLLANPALAKLITASIGDKWICHMETEMQKLEPLAKDPEFKHAWIQIKQKNKEHLKNLIFERTGIIINPNSLFDIQVKRIHEYKRQHLNVLYIISRYLKMIKNPEQDFVPRTVIFGGKAAPGYFLAKLIIKLINNVADVVNNDPKVAGRLKVVFFPNFNVKNGHSIYPAADLSEQISTAGKEASGTGNMKFSMNGALTIGTLDGANIEIMNAVGKENFFLFGLTAEEVAELDSKGYNPRTYLENNHDLREVITLINDGFFSKEDPNLFKPIVNSLLNQDPYKLLADFASYEACQSLVDLAFENQDEWVEKSILNAARVGWFSSDRSIREYASKIWKL